jgi:glycosyltransferase involved in cell wall biosynthesis
LLEKMGDAGRQLVKDNFAWQVVGERLDAVYQQVVEPKKVKV